jgi:hypothetical protein
MKIRKIFLGLLVATLAFGVPLYAGNGSPESAASALANVIAALNKEASQDVENPMLLAELIQKEFGTREDELRWAVKQSLSWGEITTLAYIQATIGKSFEEMTRENARHNFWSYAENAGMSFDKMAHAMESFMKRTEKERNTRIFERLRASRRVHPMPDLGSGFGLFQEALDFRRIDDVPPPTKIHQGPGVLAKGEK